MNHEPIARTGFLISLVSYALFWLIDIVRPGFVARFFSVHLFLLCAIVFGIWWASVVKEYADHPAAQFAIAALCGLLAAVLVWNIGESFEGSRGIVSLIALCVPMFVVRLVRYK